MFRLLLIVGLMAVLVIKLLPLLSPILGPQWRQSVARTQVAVDVAGGGIMLMLIGVQLLRGELVGAALLTLIGIPVFIGTYKAFPAWWYGSDDRR